MGLFRTRILKKGIARRIIFLYPSEELTYLDNAHVTLYENGIVHVNSPQEETTTQMGHCEIIWRAGETEEEPSRKLRLLKLEKQSP